MFKREHIIYTGESSLKSNHWKPYFSKSTIGNSYDVLWEVENNRLVMTDTEYERVCHRDFYDALFEGADMLSIGYGIGFILPEIRLFKCNLTVIEKYKEVIDLEPNDINDVNLIIDDATTCDYNKLFPNERFDIIWWDPFSETQFQTDHIKFLLKPNGKLIRWNHIADHIY